MELRCFRRYQGILYGRAPYFLYIFDINADATTLNRETMKKLVIGDLSGSRYYNY